VRHWHCLCLVAGAFITRQHWREPVAHSFNEQLGRAFLDVESRSTEARRNYESTAFKTWSRDAVPLGAQRACAELQWMPWPQL